MPRDMDYHMRAENQVVKLSYIIPLKDSSFLLELADILEHLPPRTYVGIDLSLIYNCHLI